MHDGLRRILYLFCILQILCFPSICAAWGNKGHQTIGGIADRILAGTPTEARVKALLKPGESLASISTWADCAKGLKYCQAPLTQEMKDYIAANPEHHSYHYTDVWYQNEHYSPTDVGAKPTDIVNTIEQAVAALEGVAQGPQNPHGFTPRQALLLLAHLVGDLHQPLHVGAVYLTDEGHSIEPTRDGLSTGSIHATEGGNLLHDNGGDTRLHSYWDTNAVALVMTKFHVKTSDALAEALHNADPAPVVLRRNDVNKSVRAWADETLSQARVAFQGTSFQDMRKNYKNQDGNLEAGWPVTLPTKYSQTARQIAEVQLTRAGKRLAALLQAAIEP